MSLPNPWRKSKTVNHLHQPGAFLLSISYIAAYAIVVRGSEYDLPPDRLDDIVALSVSSFSGRDRRYKRANIGADDEDYER
jgi:hypothetical protein